MQGKHGGAMMWSVAVQWVRWPWGFPGNSGKDQMLPPFFLGLPFLSYTAI